MPIVANDRNEVTAISARSGAEIWERTLVEPVKRAALPCGIVSFVGVTGTPVIDYERASLYLDAMVMRGGEPRQKSLRSSSPTGRPCPAGGSMWRRR